MEINSDCEPKKLCTKQKKKKSRNAIWCVDDNMSYICHICAKKIVVSNFN